MAALAEAPLRRRALEKQGMTREQELELLIQEQQADDTHMIPKGLKVVSIDAPAPGGSAFARGGRRQLGEVTLGDFVGIDEDGEVVSFLPRDQRSLFLVSVKHASFDAYNNKGCRCRQCKNFMAEYRRAKRAA